MRTDQKLLCLKCLLTIFLIILWILGSAVFGVLLWLRLDFWTNEYLELDKSLDRYLILIYVSLVDGALILIFSLFGLIGGLRTVKWSLVVYLTALCFAFGLTVTGSVYGFVYQTELKDTVGKNDLIRDIVQTRFNDEPMNKITRAVNIMQSELKCCGGDGPTDYGMSNWKTASLDRDGMAPASCCKDYFRYQDAAQTCPVWEPNTSGSEQVYNPNIQTEGCKTALVSFFGNYIIIVAGVAVAIGILQLICIVVVSILIHVLNNLYVPQPDDIVYDMARNQEKSPYPSRGDYRDYYR